MTSISELSEIAYQERHKASRTALKPNLETYGQVKKYQLPLSLFLIVIRRYI